MSQAHEAGHNEGHYGAAVISAYYLSRENELGEETQTQLQKQVDGLIERFKIFFTPQPEATADPNLTYEIVKTLEGNISHLQAIGHNVIFATLALKALLDVPHLITHPVVSGICKLIERFNDFGPGGPFPGWTPQEIDTIGIKREDGFPAYDSEAAIANFTFDAFLNIETICEGGHAGVVGHLLPHADVLIELSRMGYHETARRGYTAHQVHAKLVTKRFSPDEYEMKPRQPTPYNPLTEPYWAQGLGSQSHWAYGHYFKYPIGVNLRLLL